VTERAQPGPRRGIGRHMQLTPREADALDLFRKGMSNKEIGLKLGIVPQTVAKLICKAREKVFASRY
jgi:DNA-binding CsgD family transcriptional regulator